MLDAVRAHAPSLVRALPAHVSLLYPGPPPEAVAEVTRLTSALPPVVTCEEILTGEDGFVGLAVPELDPVLARLRDAFPRATPYGGRYGEAPAAHVTLALGARADEITALVRDLLPVRSEVVGPLFVENTATGWRPVSAPPP
ncbi:hypothetical protein FHX82_003511 [Amycolatopsis bartoniae]|uniref:2'-5' RNA ligase family protein n=1 Tax=Amycolatopsis bartoniae TaxID=941986 RepID=A0A8H9IW77_9PSEU|nr:2'-5' RNA ligase family protein [Amycolatopsis bartoniae]MBB2936447.1 hypothetical protein [Amycolatopsis bartoniae]TVT11066.1 2'-5' RNA ligase family protein [Amycolatopsis bartoniae]GHF68885.1 hypothetical protein GCM10017566_48430 [Amycolatopsis bartoniae]